MMSSRRRQLHSTQYDDYSAHNDESTLFDDQHPCSPTDIIAKLSVDVNELRRSLRRASPLSSDSTDAVDDDYHQRQLQREPNQVVASSTQEKKHEQHIDDDSFSCSSPVWQPMSTTARLKDWKMHRMLGEGQFGQVWLVSDQSKGPNRIQRPCAMKVMAKYDLAEENEIVSVLREKEIMQKLKHPFIVQLITTYQDEHLVYMLMELIQGGELYSLLHNTPNKCARALPELQAQFYSFCLADALAYIHEHRIVYRDLKPENVLVDAHGYPVLVDFGLSKQLDDCDEYTYTMRGTANYLAPEIINGDGHNEMVDYWSLGILTYEMLSGRHPFLEDGMDQMELFECISDDDYKALPSQDLSDDAIDFVAQLLIKDPNDRMGSHRLENHVLGHLWFSHLDKQALRCRLVDGPWVPSLRDAYDTSMFEDETMEYSQDKTKQIYPPISKQDQKLLKSF